MAEGNVNFSATQLPGLTEGGWEGMTTRSDRRYAGFRYPAEIIATAAFGQWTTAPGNGTNRQRNQSPTTTDVTPAVKAVFDNTDVR